MFGAASMAAAAPDVEQLLGLASASAPEIHASALLALAAQPDTTGKQRTAWAVQAFELAAQAREQYPRLPLPGAAPDTSEAYRTAASLALHLDRLTLQSRAIALAGPQAADLLARLEPPATGKLSCESAFVPDLRPYYALPGDPGARLAKAASLLELAALAPHITAQAHREAFARKLAQADPDSRTFAASWPDLHPLLVTLPPDAVRAFLLKNLNAPRCADARISAREIVDWYHAAFDPKRPIADADIELPKPEGRATAEPASESAITQALREDLRRLRFDAGNIPLSAADRAQSAWRVAAEELVSKLRDSSEAGFHTAAALLQALIELTPDSPLRRRFTAEFVEVLQASDLQLKSPQEWLWRAHSLLAMLEHDPAAREFYLTALESSASPALVVYAATVRLQGAVQ